MNLRRTKASADVRGMGAIDMSYNDVAGALKVLGPIAGKLVPKGVATTAVAASQRGAIFAMYNDDPTATQFVTTGSASVSAPTGFTDGIAIPPKSYLFIALGNDTHVRSTATVYAYEVTDESNYAPTTT